MGVSARRKAGSAGKGRRRIGCFRLNQAARMSTMAAQGWINGKSRSACPQNVDRAGQARRASRPPAISLAAKRDRPPAALGRRGAGVGSCTPGRLKEAPDPCWFTRRMPVPGSLEPLFAVLCWTLAA